VLTPFRRNQITTVLGMLAAAREGTI